MTPVIFRRWRGRGGEVFALFPTLAAGDGCVTSYQHVGQHDAANYALCMAKSRPALALEYAELLKELRKIGYDDLEIHRRRQPWMRPKKEG